MTGILPRIISFPFLSSFLPNLMVPLAYFTDSSKGTPKILSLNETLDGSTYDEGDGFRTVFTALEE